MPRAIPEWVLEYLEIVLKHKGLPKFVSASIQYRFAPEAEAGKTALLYEYYVGALYEKDRKGDVENFDQMVFDAFAQKLALRELFYRTLRMYKQVLLCEEEGTATFQLPREPLFAIIKQNILENAAFYSWFPNPEIGHKPVLSILLNELAEIHRITGQQIITEAELQALTNA